MKKMILALSAIALFLLLAGCSTTSGASSVPPTVIVAEDSTVSLASAEELAGPSYWREVACSPEAEEAGLAAAGERNLVVLPNSENVAFGVKNGQFLVGILPAGSEAPEGTKNQIN